MISAKVYLALPYLHGDQTCRQIQICLTVSMFVRREHLTTCQQPEIIIYVPTTVSGVSVEYYIHSHRILSRYCVGRRGFLYGNTESLIHHLAAGTWKRTDV